MVRHHRILLAPALLLAASAASPVGAPAAVAPSSRPPALAGSDARAASIIEKAIAAHGGRERWRGKRDVTFRTTWTHFDGGRPSVSSRYTFKFPIRPGLLRMRVEAEENGKPVVMGLSGLRSWFMVGPDRSEDLDVLRANRAFIRKAYAMLALPFRLDDPSYTFRYDGYEVRSGASVDRVRVEHGLDAPLLVLFDRDSGRIAGIGSEVADPPTSTIGDYLDFTEFEGILIPQVQVFDRFDMLTGGRARTLMVSVDGVSFGNGLPPEAFEPPPIP